MMNNLNHINLMNNMNYFNNRADDNQGVENEQSKWLSQKNVLLNILKNQKKLKDDNNVVVPNLNEENYMKNIKNELNKDINTFQFNNIPENISEKLKNIIHMNNKDGKDLQNHQADLINYIYQNKQMDGVIHSYTNCNDINEQAKINLNQTKDKLKNISNLSTHSGKLEEQNNTHLQHLYSQQQRNLRNLMNTNEGDTNIPNVTQNKNHINSNTSFLNTGNDENNNRNVNEFIRIMNNECMSNLQKKNVNNNNPLNNNNNNSNNNKTLVGMKNIVEEKKQTIINNDTNIISNHFLTNEHQGKGDTTKTFYINKKNQNVLSQSLNNQTGVVNKGISNKHKTNNIVSNKSLNNSLDKKNVQQSNMLDLEDTKRPDALRDKCWQYVDPKGVVQVRTKKKKK
ncbi:hypothetical protein PFFVO_06097, partial [Plasmodium falciparum Vietnam Oak-Knoll (FVO)]